MRLLHGVRSGCLSVLMATICKPPEPLSFCGNVSQNWKGFEEQLTWFLEGTESSSKSDMVKIGIMLSHARKEARKCIKHCSGMQKVITRNLPKLSKRLEDTALHASIFFMKIYILDLPTGDRRVC